MVFTNDDKVAIKFLRQNKGYGAKRLMSKFLTKSWKLSGLKKLIKKIDETGSIERRPGGRVQRDVMITSNKSSSLH